MSQMPSTPGQERSTEQWSDTDLVRSVRFDDAPMRSKIALMIIMGILVGILVHRISSQLDNTIILGQQVPGTVLAVLGFLAGGATLILIGQWWIASPYDRLVKQIDKIADRRHITDLSALPLTRRDEAGRIARAMHRVTTVAIRDGMEARQLRRTIDERVQEETRRSTEQLRRLALRDPLTELGNRRFLDEHLPNLIKVAKASGTDVVAMVLDMDGFKQVNDELGHDAGDELLIIVSGLLKACTRHDDMAVRLGGDEFVVLMPGCNRQRAIELSNAIRMLFLQQAKPLLQRAKLRTNISAGIASLREDDLVDASALIKLADQRLYEAKRSGKGQTR